MSINADELREQETLFERARIEVQLHDYWHDVDRNYGRNRAQSTWYLLAYAADGEPVLPTHAPINITLVSDTYERQGAGRWLCAHRNFEVLFAGGTKPTNQKVDQQ